MTYKRYSRDVPPPVMPSRRPPQPLTDAEQARAAEHRLTIHQHMPELLPIMRDMVALGMIDGWRNVVEVSLNEDAQHESAHQPD